MQQWRTRRTMEDACRRIWQNQGPFSPLQSGEGKETILSRRVRFREKNGRRTPRALRFRKSTLVIKLLRDLRYTHGTSLRYVHGTLFISLNLTIARYSALRGRFNRGLHLPRRPWLLKHVETRPTRNRVSSIIYFHYYFSRYRSLYTWKICIKFIVSHVLHKFLC